MRLDADQRREQIVAAAIQCFSRGGPDRWTLRQVSREAGVAPSLITHFFGSWSGLVAAAYSAMRVGSEAALERANAGDGMGAEERMEVWIGEALPEGRRCCDLAGAIIAFRALARSDPDLDEALRRMAVASREALPPILAALAAERGARADLAALEERLISMACGLRCEIADGFGALTVEGARARLWSLVDASLPRR